MRSHEAGQQATALETVLAKALMRLGFDQDGGSAQQDIATAISDALLEAYSLGAIEGAIAVPVELDEVAYRSRPTPADMLPMTRQGWVPWMVSETMVNKNAAATVMRGKDMVPGFLVRYQRRMQPSVHPVSITTT